MKKIIYDFLSQLAFYLLLMVILIVLIFICLVGEAIAYNSRDSIYRYQDINAGYYEHRVDISDNW